MYRIIAGIPQSTSKISRMDNQPRVLCVIPARGGSKSVPKKNLKNFCGKPLVAWPIEVAKSCAFITTVVCSSDDEEILITAKKFGAEVRTRPAHLATDEAASPPVVLDVIDTLEKEGAYFDYVFMLEATSPLTESSDLSDAFFLLLSKSDTFDSLVSVSQSISGHPDFTFTVSQDFSLTSINQLDWRVKRRQDISQLYFIEGSLYLSKISSLKASASFVQKNTIGFEVPREKSFEIDDEIDFYILEAIMKYRRNTHG